MIELDDCGKELHLSSERLNEPGMGVIVSMVIKAPRGTMALFRHTHKANPFVYVIHVAQGKAIKAFMEEHQHD